jgi:hypothetical protein
MKRTGGLNAEYEVQWRGRSVGCGYGALCRRRDRVMPHFALRCLPDHRHLEAASNDSVTTRHDFRDVLPMPPGRNSDRWPETALNLSLGLDIANAQPFRPLAQSQSAANHSSWAPFVIRNLKYRNFVSALQPSSRTVSSAAFRSLNHCSRKRPQIRPPDRSDYVELGDNRGFDSDFIAANFSMFEPVDVSVCAVSAFFKDASSAFTF